MDMGEPQHFDTLVDIYQRSIGKFADRELFGTKKDGAWHWTTYREFGRQVEGLRGGLAGLGLKRGDAIAIIADNRVEWAVTAYAAFGLGVALVPMYEAQLEKDWEFIIKDCAAKALVVSKRDILDRTKKFLELIPSLEHIIVLDGASDGHTIHAYDALVRAGEKSPAPITRAEKKDTACIIYTSGTTGVPKGVILSHNNIASNVTAMNVCFPMFPEDRSLSFLPWAHSFGQTVELHALFSQGGSMGLAESVPKILENLSEVRPTLLFSVPRIFNRLYMAVQKQISEKPGVVQAMVKAALRAAAKQRDGQKLTLGEGLVLGLANKLVFSKVRARFGGRLKYAFSGGAAISREVAEFIDGIGVMVYEGYGLTETSPIATGNSPTRGRRIGSVGKVIPDCRIVIDTSSTGGKKTEGGRDEGELVVYGPNVMQGYHNRPEENAAVFTSDGGFRTGDMGYIDPDGFVFITGRIKEQYKLENGKYVVPTPLEEEIKLSPYVTNVMVYGDNRPHNVALVVANLDAVKAWAEKEGHALPGGGGQALLEDAKVRELLSKEIEKYSEKFKGFEAVQDFAVIDSDFTTENGMLTPSLKLKRRSVLEKYGPLLDALYKKRAEAKKQGARAAV
ncbi:AMP-dependent synthetase/ligase [Pendulispora albinea]|uniref:Long-chain fatty acid--CoA ligase n=1 Tax=Pendulispora albinea TaxID=2741071 RepID=A0ABZ2LIZ5_9BACT